MLEPELEPLVLPLLPAPEVELLVAKSEPLELLLVVMGLGKMAQVVTLLPELLVENSRRRRILHRLKTMISNLCR